MVFGALFKLYLQQLLYTRLITGVIGIMMILLHRCIYRFILTDIYYTIPSSLVFLQNYLHVTRSVHVQLIQFTPQTLRTERT